MDIDHVIDAIEERLAFVDVPEVPEEWDLYERTVCRLYFAVDGGHLTKAAAMRLLKQAGLSKDMATGLWADVACHFTLT